MTRLCDTFGLERKHLPRLLNGTRRYKPPYQPSAAVLRRAVERHADRADDKRGFDGEGD